MIDEADLRRRQSNTDAVVSKWERDEMEGRLGMMKCERDYHEARCRNYGIGLYMRQGAYESDSQDTFDSDN